MRFSVVDSVVAEYDVVEVAFNVSFFVLNIVSVVWTSILVVASFGVRVVTIVCLDEGAIVIFICGNEVADVSNVIVDVVVVSTVIVDAAILVAVFDLLVEAVVVDIGPGVEMVVRVTFVIAVALVSLVFNDVALAVIVFVVVVVLLELLAKLVVIAFFGRVVFFVVADMALST